MKVLYTMLCAAAFLALAIPAGAAGCVPTSSTPTATVTDPTNGQLHYLVVDSSCPTSECLFSVFVYDYVETNGIAGLQRNDLQHDDTCGGEIAADGGGGALF